MGTAVIVRHNGKVLLSKRLSGAKDGVGKWACPGGGLEPTDCDIIAGAARELLEETGLVMSRGYVHQAVEEGRRAKDGVPYLTVFVVCEVDDISTLCNPEPHKHTDWQWFAPGQLPGDNDSEVLWSRDTLRDLFAERPC